MGYWVDDKPHGRGSQILENGAKYVGDFKNGAKHGECVYQWAD